jgi:hypothetical protein
MKRLVIALSVLTALTLLVTATPTHAAAPPLVPPALLACEGDTSGFFADLDASAGAAAGFPRSSCVKQCKALSKLCTAWTKAETKCATKYVSGTAKFSTIKCPVDARTPTPSRSACIKEWKGLAKSSSRFLKDVFQGQHLADCKNVKVNCLDGCPP